MTRPPCYGCTRRNVVCHAHCTAYRDWAADVRKGNEKQRQEKEPAAYARANYDRWRKKHKDR